MTNKEWMLLISKEFNVSHTVAKGMLHAMYRAKDILSVNKEMRKQQAEEDRKYREMCFEEHCQNLLNVLNH